MALPTADLSTQALYQIKQPSMYTFTLCQQQICELLSENSPRRCSKCGNNFDLTEQDKRLFENGSEEAYQGAATMTALVGWNPAV